MSIFPLPLNAIEHYMLADDSADYPRLFRFVIRLRTPLDESRLRQAVEAAVERHPLLRAVVEYEEGEPRSWRECPEPVCVIRSTKSICEAGRAVEEVVEPIDLKRQPALRLRIDRAAEGDVLTLEFHHAAVDGLAGIQFVREVLVLYASARNVASEKLPELDESRLASRDGLGLTGWRRPLRWIYGSAGWLGAIEYLWHRPVPLGDVPELPTSSGRESGFISQTLSDAETQWLRSAAKKDRATINDRLIRDVFLAMQEYVELHAPEWSRRLKRIMVPVNLRVKGDDALPAANVVAMVNIDRRPHRWANPTRMLRVLHWEMAAVKRLRLGVIFVLILGTLHRRFGLQRFLSNERCQATCVVSNLGAVLPEFSNDLVSAVEFYPPIRPLTAVAFGAATCGERLTLSLHYDAAAMSKDEATELLRSVCELLKERHSGLVSLRDLAGNF